MYIRRLMCFDADADINASSMADDYDVPDYSADKDGENDTDAADQYDEEEEAEADDQSEDDSPADDPGAASAQQQSAEENAKYAAARRKAESEMASLDQMFASKFGKMKNPITGAPITSAKGYFEALEAQERLKAEQAIRQAGVDPTVLNSLIQNDPTIRAAQEVIARNNQAEANRMLEEDYQTVMKLDPTMKTAEDIVNDKSFGDVVGYCQNHPGTRFADAYKIVNWDRLSGYKADAAKQQAINDAKSKGHLTAAAAGEGGGTNDKEIPSGELDKWRAMFPDKSRKELRALYNKVQKRK